MKFLLTVGLALVLLTVESVAVKYLGLTVTRIDVTVTLVVFLALRAGTIEGAISAFTVGYLLDVMSGNPTGLYPFLAVLIFLLARLGAALVDARSLFAFALFTAGADFGHGLLAALFTWLTSKEGSVPTASLSGLPLQLALTVTAAVLLWPLLRRIDPGQERAPLGLLR
ncbi:MAG: rod shape-determining protein MreD [Myxococcaceae bacterium]